MAPGSIADGVPRIGECMSHSAATNLLALFFGLRLRFYAKQKRLSSKIMF